MLIRNVLGLRPLIPASTRFFSSAKTTISMNARTPIFQLHQKLSCGHMPSTREFDLIRESNQTLFFALNASSNYKQRLSIANCATFRESDYETIEALNQFVKKFNVVENMNYVFDYSYTTLAKKIDDLYEKLAIQELTKASGTLKLENVTDFSVFDSLEIPAHIKCKILDTCDVKSLYNNKDAFISFCYKAFNFNTQNLLKKIDEGIEHWINNLTSCDNMLRLFTLLYHRYNFETTGPLWNRLKVRLLDLPVTIEQASPIMRIRYYPGPYYFNTEPFRASIYKQVQSSDDLIKILNSNGQLYLSLDVINFVTGGKTHITSLIKTHIDLLKVVYFSEKTASLTNIENYCNNKRAAQLIDSLDKLNEFVNSELFIPDAIHLLDPLDCANLLAQASDAERRNFSEKIDGVRYYGPLGWTRYMGEVVNHLSNFWIVEESYKKFR